MPRAFNANPDHPAVQFLLRLHADIAGRLLDNRKQAERLARDMKHVEAVVRMFDPAHDVRPLAVRRRKGNPWFKRGTMFRAVLDVLKAADEPLTVREITRRVLAGQGESAPPLKAIRQLEGGIRAGLRDKQGRSIEVVGEGMPARWRLARGDV
jgi:hypothetical protein